MSEIPKIDDLVNNIMRIMHAIKELEASEKSLREQLRNEICGIRKDIR